jgi:MtN3 and saliva related transmembrane protein
MREIIGWGSAVVLLPTFGLQAYKQWQGRHEHAPASTLWFFILALVGVTGQVAYSWMLGNWVYLVLNACLVVTNALGLALAVHRRGVKGPRPAAVSEDDGDWRATGSPLDPAGPGSRLRPG